MTILPTAAPSTWGDERAKIDTNFNGLDSRISILETMPLIYVTQSNIAATLGGVIDSTKAYFLTGNLNVAGVEILVPPSGFYMTGINFDLSGLFNTVSGESLFVGVNAGDILYDNCNIRMSGVGSHVYSLIASTGNEAIEIDRVNFNDCASLGTVDGYRQGLETGTGRFGGTPQLTLDGTWAGGYFIDTSIVRNLDPASYSLFKAGPGFTMESRFRSNHNVDLAVGVSFFDFAAGNFPNPSTVQLTQCRVTRDGVSDATDPNLTPNMQASALAAEWIDNIGLSNTFVGGELDISSEITTELDMGVSTPLAGTFIAVDMQHFDSPENGQLRHLGESPMDFKADVGFMLTGSAGDMLELIFEKSTDGGTVFIEEKVQEREVLNAAGSSDNPAIFAMRVRFPLGMNDRVRLSVRNTTSGDDVTAKINGFMIVERRR